MEREREIAPRKGRRGASREGRESRRPQPRSAPTTRPIHIPRAAILPTIERAANIECRAGRRTCECFISHSRTGTRRNGRDAGRRGARVGGICCAGCRPESICEEKADIRGVAKQKKPYMYRTHSASSAWLLFGHREALIQCFRACIRRSIGRGRSHPRHPQRYSYPGIRMVRRERSAGLCKRHALHEAPIFIFFQ